MERMREATGAAVALPEKRNLTLNRFVAMRAYRTLDQLDSLKGALRTFDLLGDLPLRELSIPTHDPFHDWAALADDWEAVAQDLRHATLQILEDPTVQESLAHLHNDQLSERLTHLEAALDALAHAAPDQLDEVQLQLSEFADAVKRQCDEIENLQMTLFGPEMDEKAG